MQFSEEQIKKAFAAKSAEELLEMAKAEGFSLTEEEAEQYFKVLHADPADAECMELSEEEQENVAGGSQCVGGKSYSSDPPYNLITTGINTCPLYEDHPNPPSLSIKGTCWACFHSFFKYDNPSAVTYCEKRTVDNDPYR